MKFKHRVSFSILLVTLQGCGDAATAPLTVELDGKRDVMSTASTTYHVPSSIASNCSSDVTVALQNWIASVPNNSTLVFPAGACYNIDGGLVIDDRHGLTFEGNGATFRVFSRGGPERANFTFRGGSNLTLRNLVSRGANPNAGTAEAAYDPKVEWQHGFRLRAVQGALLEGLQAYDVYGDFVGMNHDGRVARPGPPNRDITVRGGHFERNGRMGITVTHGERIRIEDNYVGQVRMFSVDVELNDDREVGRDIWVERNTFGPSRQGFFASMGKGKGSSVGNIYIRHNQTTRDHPITCDARIAIGWPDWAGKRPASEMWQNFIIEDNLIYSLRRNRTARLATIREVDFRRNTVIGIEGGTSACGTDGPLDLRDSHNVRITDNTIQGEASPMWGRVFVADSWTTGVTESNNKLGLVTASNQAPVADFTYSCSGSSCNFTDRSTDADGSISSWNWNLGNSSTSTAKNPSVTYSAVGTYNVTQTVTDNAGATAATSKTINCTLRGGRIRCS